MMTSLLPSSAAAATSPGMSLSMLSVMNSARAPVAYRTRAPASAVRTKAWGARILRMPSMTQTFKAPIRKPAIFLEIGAEGPGVYKFNTKSIGTNQCEKMFLLR